MSLSSELKVSQHQIDVAVKRIIDEVGLDKVKYDISYISKLKIDKIIKEELEDCILFCGLQGNQIILERCIFQIILTHILRDFVGLDDFSLPPFP